MMSSQWLGCGFRSHSSLITTSTYTTSSTASFSTNSFRVTKPLTTSCGGSVWLDFFSWGLLSSDWGVGGPPGLVGS